MRATESGDDSQKCERTTVDTFTLLGCSNTWGNSPYRLRAPLASRSDHIQDSSCHPDPSRGVTKQKEALPHFSSDGQSSIPCTEEPRVSGPAPPPRPCTPFTVGYILGAPWSTSATESLSWQAGRDFIQYLSFNRRKARMPGRE